MSSKVTYRQQYTRCGKERCLKCKEGAGHGPYWYAYWSENGRTVSKYIGIRPPSGVEIARQTPQGAEARVEAGQETKLQSVPHFLAATSSPTQSIATQGPDVSLQLHTQVLRIYVLGQFRVERMYGNEWSSVVNRTWHGRRARALLGCLLSNAGRRMAREQIMEALWPNLDIETAANRLNGAVHELRQILEPELPRPALSRMLRLQRDMLELADRASIWVDAEAFEHLVNEANALWGQATHATSTYRSLSAANAAHIERLLESAAALYAGDYLVEELYSEWAAPRREALRRSWIGLLLRLSELREARGALPSAMEPLNRLLATDPTDETAVQRLMLLLTQLDRRGEALYTYRRLADRLQQNYDSEPLPETRELYEKIRQGHIGKALEPKIIIAPAAASIPVEEAAQPVQTNAPTQDTPLPQLIAPFVSTNYSARSNQSPLVGRICEMETMRQLMLSIEGASTDLPSTHTTLNLPVIGRQGEPKTPHAILLMGEAGIGKTRLAEELSHEAHTRGWTVAWTRAYEQAAIPYQLWIELLRVFIKSIPTDVLVATLGKRTNEETSANPHSIPTILARLSTLLPELRDMLPPNSKLYSQLSSEQERLHLWEATLELLIALSRIRPLLLVLDDLHWTDGSSRELLAYLTRHIQDQRILLLGTCCDVGLAPDHGLRTLITDLRREQAITTIPIQPLTSSQIGSLLAHLPPTIVQSIQAQAAGNPFFAEELARVSEVGLAIPSNSDYADGEQVVRLPIHSDENGREAFPPGSTLPEGITAVLERRLSTLSRECQQLLGEATVLGGSFEFSQLASMLGEQNEDTLLDLLEEALQAGLLTEEGMGAHITYHFWHPLIASHLYERLPAARYAQLHRRAATSLINTQKGRKNLDRSEQRLDNLTAASTNTP